MTDADRKLLDTHLTEFDSFIDFLKFTFKHDIEFDMQEWEEYRDKMFKIIKNGTLEDGISKIKVNTNGLILPNNR